MNKYLTQYTEAGKTLTTVIANSKKPVNNWSPATDDELQNHNGNWAWVLGDDDLIIDIDVKNGSPGGESLWYLEEKLGVMFNPSVTTPSGGTHIYLKKPSHIKTNKTLPDYPGIDFLRKGDICLIPDSKVIYEDGTEGVYRFAGDNTQFVQKDAPEALLSMLATDSSAAPSHTTTPAVKKDNGSVLLTTDHSNISETVTYPKPSATQVRKMLSHIRDEDIESHDDWLHIGMALHDWDPEKGFSLFEEFSQAWPKYKFGLTQIKWDSFSKRDDGYKIGTLRKIATDNGYVHVKETNDGDIPEWCQDWVRVRSNDKYFNKKTRVVETYRGFNSENGKYISAGKSGGKISAVKFVDDNGFIESVEDFYYQPTSADPIIEVRGVKYANSYNPVTKLTPATDYTDNGKKAIKALQDHIRTFFGEDIVEGFSYTKSELFLTWIAHQYQNTGQIIRWCPLLQSKQGLGKSFFRRLLKDLIGGKNVQTVYPNALKSGFTAWGKGYAINVLEELEFSGNAGREAYKTLKPFITDLDIEITKKGHDPEGYDNYSNYISFTNSKTPLPLESEDRRFWVTFCPIATNAEFEKAVGKKKADYFRELIALTTNHIDEIAKYFNEFEIADEFYSIEEAPNSPEKRMMMNAENASIEGLSEIEKIIEDEKTPFVTADVFSSADLFKAYEAENHKLTKHQKSLILENLGCTALDPVKIGKFTKRLWITRDITKQEAVQILKDHNARIGYHDVDLPEIKFSMGK